MLPDRRRLVPLLALATSLASATSLAGCSRPPPPPAPPPPPPREAFSVDPAALRREDPAAARSFAESPLSYFRLSNRAFADAACVRWASAAATMPAVPAHGDAQVEQYAASADGRGLVELDVVASGPPIVDLARFATSLVLALPSDVAGAHAAVDALLHGYERTLDDPQAAVPEPSVVARLRARGGSSLDAVPDSDSSAAPAWMGFFEDLTARLRERDPSIDVAFFKPKAGGRGANGRPGGRVERIVARVEGPSPAPEDDVVVEARGFEPSALGSCMRLMDVATVPAFHAPPAPGAPERFLGAAVVGTEPFYVHVWAPQRTTLRAKDIQSAVELAEVAEDAGAELGRLHGRAGDGEAHRALLKRAVDSIRGDLPVAAVELAGQFTRAWRAYLKESNQVAWTRAPRRPAAAAVDGGASVDAGAPPDAGP